MSLPTVSCDCNLGSHIVASNWTHFVWITFVRAIHYHIQFLESLQPFPNSTINPFNIPNQKWFNEGTFTFQGGISQGLPCDDGTRLRVHVATIRCDDGTSETGGRSTFILDEGNSNMVTQYMTWRDLYLFVNFGVGCSIQQWLKIWQSLVRFYYKMYYWRMSI